jgi:arylsulfatase A-like enzyme
MTFFFNMQYFYRLAVLGMGIMASGCHPAQQDQELPNIILVVADDLGYGDLASYGNTIVKTPHLDEMAASGIRFERFYAASPVCSPTRGSILTGRHPYRYNIPWAGRHPLPFEEITIAEALQEKGYASGHFGKWHLGGLSKTINQSYFPGGPSPYSPPWLHGFDECFSTESMMPTYNPYFHVGGDYGTDDYRHIQSEPVASGQQENGFRWKDHYWSGPGKLVDEWLEGSDCALIMDRALDFILRKSQEKTPFFACVWFHTPHTPVVAGDGHRALYPDQDIQGQHWYGSLSDMDDQIGRLRQALRKLNIQKNTVIWFISDNGPSYIHSYNDSGGLRGKKAELYEGGIRVPAILEWPEKIQEARVTSFGLSTSDFYPMFLAISGINVQNQPVLDGQNVWDAILNGQQARGQAIFFQSPLPARLKKSETLDEQQYAVIEDEWKLISADDGQSYQLYNLKTDQAESNDLASENPEKTDALKKQLEAWVLDCGESAKGRDYQH